MKIQHVLWARMYGSFTDLAACYDSLASRRPNTSTILVDELDRNRQRELDDPDKLVILWNAGNWLNEGAARRIAHTPRRSALAFVWSEAYDHDISKLWGPHVELWRQFLELAPSFDCIFVHTPNMRDWISDELAKKHGGTAPPVFVLPVGWDAEAMGAPRWAEFQVARVISWGTPAGRRETLMPKVARELDRQGIMLEDVTPCFGRHLLGALDVHPIALLVGHSAIESFSTWRLWQVASTSCVLVTEPGDTWPFVAGEHFIEIDYLDRGDLVEQCQKIALLMTSAKNDGQRRFPDETDALRVIAREAHKLARQYTVDSIEDRFVLPAWSVLRGDRSPIAHHPA